MENQNPINDLSSDKLIDILNFSSEQLVKNEDWRNSVSLVFDYLGNTVDVTRICLFHFIDNSDTFKLINIWYKNQESSLPIKESIFPDNIRKTLEQNLTYYLSCELNLPEDEQKYIEAIGVKSSILIPIALNHNPRVWGFVGFSNCNHIIKWTDIEIASFKSLANLLGLSIHRWEINNELKLKDLVMAISTEAIIFINHEDKITYNNSTMVELWGYDIAEIVNLSLGDLWQDPKSADIILRHIKQHGLYRGEHMAKRKDGSLFSCYVSGNLIRDSYGNELIIVESFLDINELRQSEREKDLIINLSHDMFCVSTFNGKFIYLNSAWEQTLGWSLDHLLNTPWIDFVHPEDINKTLIAFQDLKNGKIVRDFENRYRDKNGNYKWVLWNTVPSIKDKKVYATIRDITNEKQIEIELNQYMKKLKESNQNLLEFAYLASHDLQEPLKKITVFSERIKQEFNINPSVSEKTEHYLKIILNASDRAQKLIQDLLDYSRTTTAELKFEKVNLRLLVEESIEDLELLIENNHATITIKNLDDIEIDRKLFKHVIVNLLNNAVKFHKPDINPNIIVNGIKIDTNQYMITIEDNGIGFDEKYLNKMFKVFQRLNPNQYSGSGVGLAICKNIIENHEGTITATSKIDQGSIFIIRLPIQQRISKDIN